MCAMKCRCSDRRPSVAFDVPVMPALQEAIERHAGGDNLTFLVTAQGKNSALPGSATWFREICNESRATEAVPVARPAEGGGNETCRSRRYDDATHGVVRLEDVERGRALHQKCRPKTSCCDCRQAHYRNRNWQIGNPVC